MPSPLSASRARAAGSLASKAMRGRRRAEAKPASRAVRMPEPAGRRDQRVAGQVFEADAAAVGQGMAGADDRDKRLVGDDFGDESRWCGVREADERDVEPAGVEAVDEPFRAVFGQGDLDSGVVAVKVG